MVLHISHDEVPEGQIGGEHQKGGELTSKVVYGKQMSMMFGKRPEDYHSSPHAHYPEQFNYILSGKIWIFRAGEDAHLLEPGDFSRVPSLAVHWSKVEEGPCEMVEAFTPAYIGDPEMVGENKEYASGLFTADEEPVADEEYGNIWATELYAEDEDEMMEGSG